MQQHIQHSHLGQKLAAMSILIGASAYGFVSIDAHNAAVGTALLQLETRLDAYVPFMPEFVFAYLLYYPWLLLPLAVSRDREVFFRVLGAFALMQLCAGAMFLLLPAHIVRPTVLPSGIAGDLVRFIHKVDLGWNLFPSLHVGHSTLVALFFWKHWRRFFPAVAVGSALISMSTVLIKQHYVVDIFGGLLLAWVCFQAAGQSLPARSPGAASMSSEPGRVTLLARSRTSDR